MTEVIVKIIEDDPSQHADGVDSQTQILKDFGMSLPEIKDFIAANLPPPPTPPEEVERRRQIQEELEKLEAAEKERERLAALKLSDPEAYEREVNPKPGMENSKSLSRALTTSLVCFSQQGTGGGQVRLEARISQTWRLTTRILPEVQTGQHRPGVWREAGLPEVDGGDGDGRSSTQTECQNCSGWSFR